MNPIDTMVQVHITTDGTCFIDDEFFAPPPGVSLNDAVLSHLRLEAAAAEAPIPVVIRDERANYTMAIQINADGTSQPLQGHRGTTATHTTPQAAPEPEPTPIPWGDPLPTNRPHESLPEPYRSRLEAVCASARQNCNIDAAKAADQLIGELAGRYGSTHLFTLTVGVVRGDIAWLMRDNGYGLKVWIYIARACQTLLGAAHKTTIRAVGNAVGCWRRLPSAEQLAEGNEITALLRDVPIPEAIPNLKAVHDRIRLITVTS
ncbi:hypothetical protein K7472_20820 [Streptomyces sp. PTM05]|uniref:Uncharacterized protein n=1 Tax=Streptantibioticus parmotrematis TaxID=2873249 RepID=A0ABS7QY45_9ACTN|nr:hypothetical protein [Streptantibioticus parmotrematis]MBY8887265.1 hypothetical protein [Streptantibioticus parmotrematis]